MRRCFFGRPLGAIRMRVPVLLALLLLAPGSSGAALTDSEQKLLGEISVARMMSTVERLCSREFRGRRAGSSEHNAVVDYLVSRLDRAGLDSLPGLDGYKQPLTMRYALIRSKDEIKATLSYSVPGRHGPVRKVRSFAYRNYNGSGGLELASRVVFVGYGLDEPKVGYSDYQDLDVTGKIVFWLPGKPGRINRFVSATLPHKVAAAYQRGAVACLVYEPTGRREGPGMTFGLAGPVADFPCIAVDQVIADELLGPAGLKVERLIAQPDASLPRGAEGAEVELGVTPVCDPSRLTFNVLAVLPGADSEVADEIILLGAHYDHIGDTPHGEVFPGADDNASGTSVMLEIADVLARTGLKPRRTVVFAAWTGEESGLLGSNFFASNSPIPLAKVRSNIDLDMVGAGVPRAFVISGGSAYPDHYLNLAASAADLKFTLDSGLRLGAGDHLALARKRVPSSLIYAAGGHPDYHTTRDTPAAINRSVLRDAARLAGLAVWRGANG